MKNRAWLHSARFATVCLFIGSAALVTWIGWTRIFIHNYVLPARMELSATSPDGRHVASIFKKMTLGGMGQEYILSVNGGPGVTVGGTGDYNHAGKVHWSPDSSIVIFEKMFDLLVARTTDMSAYSVATKADRDQNGRSHPHPLEDIVFTRPGAFVVVYKDGKTSQSVDLSELTRGKDGLP